ncbi:DEAD/DEAH box helicase [Solemya pervernicosa gill symbiont]|uniref:DEAD/DEAH box helicase n=1 Tax=Solemya pervernicosa gill symbiont TaxID=642797 RepID=A0A1T2L797_9GAMM|nr:DEAD/DEAH box helicase [Solemya pervernicosa gill symbiont]OOZ40914.1 DEAD/DEAH box helicase [Solemya pervernicosa gill symbiont]
MAFTKITPKTVAPASPDLLFRELPRRKFPDVLPHQQAMMQRYAAEAEGASDVALQLPTGSGKTLVGLLIAEWRRRKNKEKIVYLCPTRQLVHQAVAQAEQKYGLAVVGFTGSQRDYSASDKAKYNQGDCVAITTYSSLFNTNPYFSDADVIIVDDAHAAENYVAKMWTLSIDRLDHSHTTLHEVLSSIFEPHIDSTSYTRMTGEWDSPSDLSWVDKIPTPVLLDIHDEIVSVLDTYTKGTNLQYSWGLIRNHLRSCHVYLSFSGIVIRPIIAPTWDLPAFNNPKQRIYMSATLGEGGDLERLMGRKNILRLPVPDGWDLQGVGRRFFMFPSLSLDYEQEIQLRRSLLKKAQRSLVLVPSDRMKNEISEDINEHLSLTVFSAEDIEQSKEDFIKSTGSVAVVANRYDGIDFPGDECRLLCIEGLPKAVNSQERFFMSRMGANILFNERIQTRVLQAIGRCTRSLEDYSAVVVTGDELPDYLSDPRRRNYFHPELQAELWFGVEQSKDKDISDFEDNFDVFIENGATWESVNQMIVDQRNASIKTPFPGIEQLANAVKYEVEYQMAMWQQDYTEAVASAESVIGVLTDSQLGGYRALWEYLAGSAATLAVSAGNAAFSVKALEHYATAKKAAKGIPWLVQLSQQSQPGMEGAEDDGNNALVMFQVEKIEAILSSLGTRHDRNYSQREREILEGLNDDSKFEESHKLLGEHLGFDAGKIEIDGSPDPWWQLGDHCVVFEDHANANETSTLDTTKARQAASHPAWMKANVPSCIPKNVEIMPVLVTPVSAASSGAMPHLVSVSLWKLPDFKKWASDAMLTIRELRKTFIEPGDLVWRAEAASVLQTRGFDMVSLTAYLKSQIARYLLVERKL